MRLANLFIAALILAPLLLADSRASEVRYTATLIPLNVGHDVNEDGHVAGWYANQPYRFADGTPQALGTLGGAAADSFATAINNSSHVVGQATTSSGETHAFLYTDGVMSDLGTLPGSVFSTAYDINDAGMIVGHSRVGNDFHAFLYSDGTMQDLGANFSGASQAFGINNQGQVVGHSGGNVFLYDNGVVQDLGLGDSWDINDSGVVVGNTNDAIAAYYDGGIWHEMGTLGGPYSIAYGINNHDQIVGYAYLPNGEQRAFLYEDGTMYDLNSLIDPSFGTVLRHAVAINDRGQITGRSDSGAFLLTPIDESTSAVAIPEPGTLLLLALGLVGFGVWGRRRLPLPARRGSG